MIMESKINTIYRYSFFTSLTSIVTLSEENGPDRWKDLETTILAAQTPASSSMETIYNYHGHLHTDKESLLAWGEILLFNVVQFL